MSATFQQSKQVLDIRANNRRQNVDNDSLSDKFEVINVHGSRFFTVPVQHDIS